MSTLPAVQNEILLKPSAAFKKEATRSIVAIVGFIVVYFLLFALSLGLVALSFYGGLSLIFLKPTFITIIIGAGIIGCGVMVFVFLVKFLFSSTKEDNSDSVEITAEDHPKLFETIYALAEETGTKRPKKVFLSADVNAAVFYNSSFWSMFFPIRKNLKIGLGLVNSVNVSELKAVIAHEFGHFSQRSMKVGSWVYQVNKIIHDMLFNNRSYANSLDALASVHGIITLFVHLTVQVVKAIQWVLHQMFKVVNKSYLGLSRQMEFHADLVAASVCGSNNIISALRRSEFADACFASTLDACQIAWKEKKVVNDFYTAQRVVSKHLAKLNQLSLVNGLPVIKEDDNSQTGSRVNYKDQWASHPTLEERRAYLEPFGLTAEVDTTPAWALFEEAEKWKEELTRQFYKSIPDAEVKGSVDAQQFEETFLKHLHQYSFPPVFKEFYDNRKVTVFDPETVVKEAFIMQPFEAILTPEAIQLPKRIRFLEQDIVTLKSIINKEVVTSSFDFDGKKYPRKEAAVVLAQLEEELSGQIKELERLDQILFRYFYALAPLAEAEGLKTAYVHYFHQRKNAERFLETANRMMDHLGPVFRGESMTLESIQAMIAELRIKHETPFKNELGYWLSAGAFDNDDVLKETVNRFIASRYEYFAGDSFFDNELIELNNLVQDSWSSISNFEFALFKNLAETQAAFLEKKKQETPVEG